MEEEDERQLLTRILFLQTNDDQLTRSLLNLIDKIANERRGSAKNWLIPHDRNPALTG